MKKIEENFTRSGYTFAQNKREGAVVMFTKTQTGRPDSPTWIEVVKLIDDDGQESFPANTSWGILGFTFKSEEIDKAETKYNEMVAEYGETEIQPTEEVSAGDDTLDDDEEYNQSDSSLLAESEDQAAKADNSNNVQKPAPKVKKTKKPTGGPRGRKRADIDFQVPTSGTFRAKELADKYDVSPPFVHNRLNELIDQGKVRVVERVQGKRGKPQKIMEWVS